MKYIIGLDIGTTSLKAIAFDLEGNILAEDHEGYTILNPYPSYSEQAPDEIFDAVLRGVRFVTKSLHGAQYQLVGISCSSAMHSVIAVDKDGAFLTNAIIWADTRSSEYAEKIKNSSLGHDIYMKTGTPIHAMAPLCKIVWLRENRKEIFQKSHKFISIKEYVIFKLFGEFLVDYSIASATGLFNIHTNKWHEDALKVAGITTAHLSEPVPATHIVSGMKKGYAEKMGVSPLLPFVVGASDGCLANLGSNAIKPGNAAVTIGTSGAIRVIASQPKNDEKERIFSYILTENRYVLGGPVNNGGIILRWLRDNFAGPEISQASAKGVDPYTLLIKKASLAPTGADGLIFLPYLLGERAPHWDANARGLFFGIHINHTRQHFFRAVLEGIIFGVYSVGKALEETTGEIDVIYANGGFSRSGFWVQMLADVFNKKVYITKTAESSALGAAILGMHALDFVEDLDQVGKLVPVSGKFIPNPENHKIYQKNFEIFEQLYIKLKDEFRDS